MGEENLPSAAELKQTKLYDWQRISPKVKKVPSGKFAMRVSGTWRFGSQKR